MIEPRIVMQRAQQLIVLLGCVVLAGTAMADAPRKATDRQKERWATEWSEKVGVELEYQFDSSGPALWDPAEHPTVFITNRGSRLRRSP